MGDIRLSPANPWDNVACLALLLLPHVPYINYGCIWTAHEERQSPLSRRTGDSRPVLGTFAFVIAGMPFA